MVVTSVEGVWKRRISGWLGSTDSADRPRRHGISIALMQFKLCEIWNCLASMMGRLSVHHLSRGGHKPKRLKGGPH
ncbi:hypothetical protein [Azorhizobium sp. AG788]|uniref:hypothetical protein n=1 Tax=Azorhizobium sp. AG788 TaxID=2183897 RepID=UPI00105FC5BB|nr:hypothetical protein [Azorhizobium sp. AG788]